MRPKRLISLLVAVCMMITMLPLSAVTAFAEDMSPSTGGTASYKGYNYEYKVNADGNATITKFLGPDASTKSTGSYNIEIPTELNDIRVTGLGDYSFAVDADSDAGYPGNSLCRNIHSVTIPESVTSIGKYAFARCSSLTSLKLGENIKTIGDHAFYYCIKLESVIIPQSVTFMGDRAFTGCAQLNSLTINDAAISIGDWTFDECYKLTTLSLGEKIKTIGDYAFYDCRILNNVTIPQSVTSIGDHAFGSCYGMDSFTIKDATTSIGKYAFSDCQSLTTLSLGENITTIGDDAFRSCYKLETITLPAGLASFGNCLIGCPAGRKWDYHGNPINPIGAIYYNNDWDHAKELPGYNVLKNRNFLYLCKVTFDAKGGKTDYPEVPVYKTEKITDTKANELTAINDPTRAGYKFTGWYTKDGQPFDVNETAITEDITLHAGWEFDPNAPVCHPLTVTGGTVTVKYDGSDVTSKLNSNTDAATGQKTYYVPDGATVTVTLDKNLIPKGNVFDGWSTGEFSLPQDQNCKAETITFPMSSGANVFAKYRDAAADHTPDTAVCHPLTVTGGIVTVKNGDKDVTDTLTVTTDETTGKKTYSVPEGATVTVTLDKTAVLNGKVFDGWSTSLPTGQDCKAESITFTMNSDVNVSAKYRDAAADHTPNAPVCHPLTVTGGIVTVKNGDKDVTDTLTVTTDETTGKKTYSVPDGATVTVTLDKTLIPEGMVFDIWSTGKFSLPLDQDYKAESITFTMSTMSSDADIAAQYRDATIEDDGPNVLGTAAIIGTAAVGGAVLGYQAYSLGTEFAGKLMALPYFPSNRSALAMMLWEDAGKPMPESELLYPDVGQEEQDMDLQHAARWAMENELIPDLNDEGTAPEEMKFFPANPVSKLDVLNAWQKAQELKNN